jgi:hypothetical protein
MHIDCNFEIFDENEDLPQALIKIAPIITSIDSINSPQIDLLKMIYNNDDEASKSQLLLKEMMEKTRIMLIDW